jgi:hypothetical protein
VHRPVDAYLRQFADPVEGREDVTGYGTAITKETALMFLPVPPVEAISEFESRRKFEPTSAEAVQFALQAAD